jgi:hypothetical protein
MSVLALADARAYLNIAGTDRDGDLASTIAAAEAVIGQHCGPLASTTKTVRVLGGGCALVLPTTPAVSLTSVTPYAETAITLSDLYLDTASAVVTYNSGAGFSARYYDVVYQAGRTTCPDDLLMAVKELVRHLWSTRRGPTRRPGSDPSESTSNTVPGAAYLLPFRVSELIAPHIQPGFA